MAKKAETAAPYSRRTVRKLIELIQTDGLTVGDRLPSIRTLSGRLGVNTSVIRDAIVQAQAIGLIRIHPRSGAFVQSPDYASVVALLSDTLPAVLMKHDHNLIYLLDARRALEMESVAQAALRHRLEELLPLRSALERMLNNSGREAVAEYVRADIDFHVGIAHAAGNPVMTLLVESLLNCLRPYLLGLPWSEERRLHTEQSHAALYEAILKRNAEAAHFAMEEHLSLARDKLLLDVQNPIKMG